MTIQSEFAAGMNAAYMAVLALIDKITEDNEVLVERNAALAALSKAIKAMAEVATVVNK